MTVDGGVPPSTVTDGGAPVRPDDRLIDEIATEVAHAAGSAAAVTSLWSSQDDLAHDVGERLRSLDVRTDPALATGTAVTVAVMPWRWRTVDELVDVGDRVLEVHDDPAHIDLLRAAAGAPAGSVMVVVAGLGFLARPGARTVARSFGDVGLVVESVRRLPSRLFTPASAVPRVLIRLRLAK